MLWISPLRRGWYSTDRGGSGCGGTCSSRWRRRGWFGDADAYLNTSSPAARRTRVDRLGGRETKNPSLD